MSRRVRRNQYLLGLLCLRVKCECPQRKLFHSQNKKSRSSGATARLGWCPKEFQRSFLNMKQCGKTGFRSTHAKCNKTKLTVSTSSTSSSMALNKRQGATINIEHNEKRSAWCNRIHLTKQHMQTLLFPAQPSPLPRPPKMMQTPV